MPDEEKGAAKNGGCELLLALIHDATIEGLDGTHVVRVELCKGGNFAGCDLRKRFEHGLCQRTGCMARGYRIADNHMDI
ncbi:MAG TPA: hypothetical protein VN788_04535 [Verrucomicrobiae bacterium]|nr:hypothetical protein [Verrucomicrobiae bacterium]